MTPAPVRIAIEAWNPLAQGRYLDDPVIGRIAGEHERTPAQIILRWHIELGNILFPKTSRPERMKANLAVFDFALTTTNATPSPPSTVAKPAATALTPTPSTGSRQPGTLKGTAARPQPFCATWTMVRDRSPGKATPRPGSHLSPTRTTPLPGGLPP